MMQRLPIVLLATCFGIITSSFIPATKGPLDFKVCLLPGKIYTQVEKNKTHIEITYNGDDVFLKQLKAKGISNPTIKDTTKKHTNITTTGSLEGNKFPVVMCMEDTYLAFTHLESGSKIYVYGQCEQGKTPVMDSVTPENLPYEAKARFIHLVQYILELSVQPEKILNVGDTFSVEKPFNVPGDSHKLSMWIKVIYILKKITREKAFFTTVESYTLNMNMEDTPIKASGSGNGNVVYDIKNTCYTQYKMQDTMNMYMTYKSVAIKAKTIIGLKSDTSVSDNK